jgi:GT2 family glycosyltransferase
MKSPFLTVCICTYNRAESLERTLESLCASKGMQEGAWEVLVVDNNSTDITSSVVKEFADRLPLWSVVERSQGLSHARNRALRECRGEVLLFTDDDVQVDRSWAREYFKAAEAFPQAGWFGGRILPSWPGGRPRWVRDEALSLLAGLFVRYDIGEDVRNFCDDDPHPYGASFALRRELFEDLGVFRTDLGVSGATPGRGEEAEYLGRARERGVQGLYVGTALCRHDVDPGRLTLGHLYRYGVQKGIAEIRVNGGGSRGSRREEALYALRGIFQALKGKGDLFRQCVINMGIQAGLRRESARRFGR